MPATNCEPSAKEADPRRSERPRQNTRVRLGFMGARAIWTRDLLVLALASGVGAGTLSACQSNSSGTDTPDADFVSCVGETRATPYTPGMQVTSTAGSYVVKLLSNTFADATGKVTDEAFAKGIDVWTVEADAAATATPVDGLTIAVNPYMPDHRHGTTAVGVTPAGSGTYTISPLNLYMAGYWEITLDLSSPAGDAANGASTTDSAVLKICVPD
jgi:hypothetical protein